MRADYISCKAYTGMHPVLATNVTLKLGVPDVLPSAFYHLSRCGPSEILVGARVLPPVFSTPDPCAWHATRVDASVITLIAYQCFETPRRQPKPRR